jgi:hypothetical protein
MTLPFSSRYLVLTAITWFLACSQSARCAENDAPRVKLSERGMCQVRGSPSYAATLHYQAFDTLADCIKAGGRLPKTGRHKIPSAEEQTVPRDVSSRRTPLLFLGLGAGLLTLSGVFLIFRRFRSQRRHRAYIEPSGVSVDEERLLKACLGSEEVVERLIQLELRNNSKLSRGRAAAAALGRIERDNR